MMARMPKSGTRRGYALLIVMVTMVLAFSLWASVYRKCSAAFHVPEARVQRCLNHDGPLLAGARLLDYLESNLPAAEVRNCRIHVKTQEGPLDYFATFTSVPPILDGSEEKINWTISISLWDESSLGQPFSGLIIE